MTSFTYPDERDSSRFGHRFHDVDTRSAATPNAMPSAVALIRVRMRLNMALTVVIRIRL
jgi:hypothetical protein